MLCPGANLGCRGGKPATNRLSYDTAILSGLVFPPVKDCETPVPNWTELESPHYRCAINVSVLVVDWMKCPALLVATVLSTSCGCVDLFAFRHVVHPVNVLVSLVLKE
jgi:hypothetical protein